MARSENMRPGLIQLLEQSSVYAHRTSAPHPEIYSYRTVVLTGTTYRILSVIREAGLDFTGRTNFLAHHLVFEPGESLGINSPAEILLFWDGWKSAWEGEPQSLTPVSIPSLQTLEPPAKNWSLLLGNTALAACPYAFSAGCWWISNRLAETQMLTLMGESLRLGSSPEELWTRSFSTYLGQILDPQQYSWKGWNGHDPRTHPAGNQKAELYLDNPQSLPEGPAKEKEIAQNGTLPTVSAGTTGTKASGYKKIGLKELPKRNTQEEFISSPIPTVQGQSRAVSGEALPVRCKSEKKNWRRLGIIAVVMFSVLSVGGAGLCLYYKSEEAKQRQAEENNIKIQERRFWGDVKDNLKTLTFPRPYYEDQTKIIDILKDEHHTAQNSQKLEEATVLIIKTKPYLDNELKSVLDAYKQIVHEEDKIAEEKKKLDALKSIELRKPDDDTAREKRTEPLQNETLREQNEAKALENHIPAQSPLRQYLLSETIKEITGNTNPPVIQDDVTINVIIGNGDTADNFKEVEVLNTKGKTRKTVEELKNDTSFSFQKKNSKQEFSIVPTYKAVWIGINKDNKTNSLILIIPQMVELNIDSTKKSCLGELIDETSKLLSNTTNIYINDVLLEMDAYKQENADTLRKKYIAKVSDDLNSIMNSASNKLIKISETNNNRFMTVITNKSISNRETVMTINNFTVAWLKDANDNVRIPRNKKLRESGDKFHWEDSYLKTKYPAKYGNNNTNKYAFNEYRSDAQNLINEWRSAYYLKPIETQIDQITNEEYDKNYRIQDKDSSIADSIRKEITEFLNAETKMKEANVDQRIFIKILSKGKQVSQGDQAPQSGFKLNLSPGTN